MCEFGHYQGWLRAMRMIKRANSSRTIQFDTLWWLRDIEISYGTKLDKKDLKKYVRDITRWYTYKMSLIQNIMSHVVHQRTSDAALHYHFLHHQHCKNNENYECNINRITACLCLWRKLILSNTNNTMHIEYTTTIMYDSSELLIDDYN